MSAMARMALFGGLAVGMVAPAFAQPHSFDVPAGDLSAALLTLAHKSGMQMVYRTDELRGVKTSGIRGAPSATAALTGILQGTGFKADKDASGLVAISRAKPRPRRVAFQLPPQTSPLRETPAVAPPQPIELQAEEIVVTAQKRLEAAQDVPISITAFSEKMLAARQIRSAADLSGTVSNLAINFPNGEGMPVFSLRGVTMTDYSYSQNGPIAIYYDEVYKGNAAIQGVGLFDLERLEVLRGPQGTLYGKNTTGGAINFIARKPRFQNGGNFSLGFGNYSHLIADGAVEAAFSDTLGARVAFTFERAHGWADNAYPGAPDANSIRQYGIRGILRYKPNDDVDINIRASTSLRNPQVFATVTQSTPDGIGGPVYNAFGLPGYFRTGLGRRDVDTPNITRERWRTYAVALNAGFRLSDALSLTSISSFDKGTSRVREDSDGSPLNLFLGRFDARTRQVTQDVRLTSSFDGPFDFILGAYYSDEKIDYASSSGFFNDLDVNGDTVIDAQDCIDGGGFLACNYLGQFTQTKTSYAVYSDASYEITPKLRLHAGIRYTNDRGKIRNFRSLMRGPSPDNIPIANVIPGGDDLSATASQKFRINNVSFRLGADYKPADDILLYANYATGFRGAAFNAQAIFSPAELSIARPEKLTSVEVGFKSELFDRHVRLNGAVFRYNYRDSQVLDTDPETSVASLINIPKSRVWGAEFDLQVRPTRHLTLSTGIGLLDSKVLRGTSQGIDIRGNRLINAPSVTLTGSVDWTIPIGHGIIADANADIAYTAAQYFAVLNLPTTREGGYAVANGRIRFHPEIDAYGLSLWVKNATNAFYRTNIIDITGLGLLYTHVSTPRSYGATVDVKF